VHDIERLIRQRGGFARRRDLRAHGWGDGAIRMALALRVIFRVRHGWYAIPDAPQPAIRAVRLGGRLTGVAALESYGLPVPRRSAVDIVVPAGACRLRRPTDRTKRLTPGDAVRVHWTDPPRHVIGSESWRVSVDDALVLVLATESRDIAIACCSAVAHYFHWPDARLDAVFERAPLRARVWRCLVNNRDESHGETFVRLWLADAGIRVESQPPLPGTVGGERLDFRASPNVYIEVDGAQHDPEWTGVTPSSWQSDHARDAAVAIAGGRVLRWTYLQLYRDWAVCLAALRRSCADDLELIERRLRHPPPRVHGRRKRRNSRRNGDQTGVSWQ
jgi:very-short-patch-repair endonuclease